MKKILVTGASGLVGYNIARLLIEIPQCQVFPTVHNRSADDLGNSIQIDLQKDSIETLKENFDCIVHCAAAIPNVRFNDKQAAIINRSIDDNVIHYCVKHNCRLIYISSMSVYGYNKSETLREDTKICIGDLTSKYSYEKRNSEIRIKNKCRNYCIFRISSPYGPQQKNINVFKKFVLDASAGRKIYYFGKGERTQNFIDARDIAQAVLKCMDKPIGSFNIAASCAISMKELAYLVQKVGEEELNVFAEVCKDERADPQENVRTNIDISLADKELDWKPQIELEDGIRYWMRIIKEKEKMKRIYDIGEIPFYYSMLQTSSNPEGLPNKLKFLLTQDRNGIIRQSPSEKENDYLNLAYLKGSQISGLMDDNGIGKNYADDFLKFICENELDIAGKNILEIGCGTGYLLYKLQKLGANVLGIEPGKHGQEGREKYGIPIIIDFFEASKITEKYDIVIFYAVLEHMQNAKKFLLDIKTILKTDGRIFLSVPDCAPYIQAGDVSLLMHEHWNYFTNNTLNALVMNCGFMGNVVRSEFAGALYAVLKIGVCEEKPQISKNVLDDYIQKVEIQKRKLAKYIDSVISNESLGIYAPGRMINLISLCYEKTPDRVRFFDDNENLHERFFPGINIKVENFMDFLKTPVDVMVVATFTFGSQIKEKILNSGVKCKVVLLEELFM